MPPQSETLNLEAIGYLHTSESKKFQLSPQPDEQGRTQGLVRLLPGHNYHVALRDLEGFSRIWLLWWFHKNKNWKPTTLPPRGRTGRKGTFSTRSPYRPNPLALSCVELLRVEKYTLYIGAHDLLDETPILDIKPYIPEFDSFPEASDGWYGEMISDLGRAPDFEVDFTPLAEETLQQQEGPALRDKIRQTLELDPFPHRTRRIVEYDTGYRLSCGDWRVVYSVTENLVQVERIALRS